MFRRGPETKPTRNRFRRRKKEGEPQAPPLVEEESEQTASHITPHPHMEGEERETVQLTTHELEGPPEPREQANDVTNGRLSPHFTSHQLQPSNSGASIGYYTDESFTSLPEVHRSRGGSSASSISSYYTASGSPLPSRAAGKRVATSEGELLQSMREIQEKLAKLEGKMATMEQKLESRLGEVERQMQNFQTIGGATTGENGDNVVSPSTLPTVPEEVC